MSPSASNAVLSTLILLISLKNRSKALEINNTKTLLDQVNQTTLGRMEGEIRAINDVTLGRMETEIFNLRTLLNQIIQTLSTKV